MIRVALLLAIVSLRSVLVAQCPDGTPPPCAGAAPAQPARPAITPNSVAVLYFENLSRDSADAHLSDGLTEEVTSRLGDLAQLQVKRPNRAALRRLQDTVPDLTSVAAVLRVRYLVEGSLRREGTRVRVSARLIRGSDGFRVWGADYNRSTSDLLALQEEIAREVATGIAGRLAPADRVTLAGRPTRNPRAYEHFLRGNYYIAQREPRLAVRAIDEYEAALQLDPGFARARARLAYCYWSFLNFTWEHQGLPAESLLARGFRAVDGALRQDSSSSDAWMMRGSLLAIRNPRSYEGVRAAFERALAIDSGNAEAHHLFALELRYAGEDSAAIAEYHRALAIESGRAVSLQGVGSVLFAMRQYAAAKQWFDSTLAVDPGYYLGYLRRSRARLQLGDTEEARRDAETALRLGAGNQLAAAVLVMAEARAGDTVAARARLERVLDDMRLLNRLGPTQALFGAALAALGEQDRAMDFLERVQPRGAHLLFELRGPEFDALRSLPRFQRLLDESRRTF
jgi:TolB-like protein/Tfp pilus assembly protein PilF